VSKQARRFHNHRPDLFDVEWAAHQAAIAEEEREVDDEDMSYEEWLAGDMVEPFVGTPRIGETGTIIA